MAAAGFTAGVVVMRKSPRSFVRPLIPVTANGDEADTLMSPRNGNGNDANSGISFRKKARWPFAGTSTLAIWPANEIATVNGKSDGFATARPDRMVPDNSP